MTYISHVIKNRYAVDYLTLTTFNESVFFAVYNEIKRIFDVLNEGMEVQRAKRLQYDGFVFGGMFWGESKQNGVDHFMIDIKGGWADIGFRTVKGMGLRDGDLSCSRIDLQVTKEGVFDLGIVHNCLQSGLIDWRGRKIVHKSNLGLNEWDSITFGGKISEIKSIIYIKDLGDGVRGTRHEVRYRGKQAKGLFINLMSSDNFMGLIKKVMFNRLKKFPEFLDILLNEFYKSVQVDNVDFEGFRFFIDKSEEATFNWFINSVVPSVERLLSGKFGDEVLLRVGKLYQLGMGSGVLVDIIGGLG